MRYCDSGKQTWHFARGEAIVLRQLGPSQPSQKFLMDNHKRSDNNLNNVRKTVFQEWGSKKLYIYLYIYILYQVFISCICVFIYIIYHVFISRAFLNQVVISHPSNRLWEKNIYAEFWKVIKCFFLWGWKELSISVPCNTLSWELNSLV